MFGAKKRISLEEFKRINMEESSEMFLALMILMQNQLPCTENFFRYQKNFEKYVNSEENKTEKKEEEQKTKIIASPRMIAKLSPMASLAKKEGINFNPPSQAKLLKYSLNKDG